MKKERILILSSESRYSVQSKTTFEIEISFSLNYALSVSKDLLFSIKVSQGSLDFRKRI